MLIKVTNYCSMGCSHCMENSTVAGQHMTRETFLAALDLTERLESLAWSRGVPKRLLLSGGEATEHPDIEWFLETALAAGYQRFLLTNGMWLDNPELRAKILRPDWTDLMVQVTNDPRFYPSAPKSVPTDDPRVAFVPSLTLLITLGRLKPTRLPESPPVRRAPTSFNLRSLTRSLGDVREALYMLRARAAAGMSGNCSPSISSDGNVRCRRDLELFPDRRRALDRRERHPRARRDAVQQVRPGRQPQPRGEARDRRSAHPHADVAVTSPLVELAIVRRLKHCYWPDGIFDVYTREAVLAVAPQPRFRDEAWRGRRDPDDLTYDFGRVHFFMQQLKQGARLDPIVVETTVYPTRGGPPAWGPPHIEDGHHRFAATVLAKSRRIPMTFGGLLTTRDWLVGTTRRQPPEISG